MEIVMKINMITCMVFSPTGGGLRIASSLKNSRSDYQVDVVNITKPGVREQYLEVPKNTDYLLVVFPVYADTLPDIVSKHLEKLVVTGLPISIVATYGNIYPGKALSKAKAILEDKGNTICSACTIVTAHSYNGNHVELGIGEPSQEKLKVINQFISESIKKIEQSNQLNLCNISVPAGRIRLRSRAPQKLFPQIFIRQPKVQIERCNQCKVCLNICPSGAIDENLSIDNRKCIRCAACIKYCRNKARTFETRTQLLQFILMQGGKEIQENKFYI
jgi:ferredoxin